MPMKRKINILIPIFVILVVIYVIRSVSGTRIQIEALHRGSMEDMISTKGILIKEETVLGYETGGIFEPLVQEGARVSVGQEVAAVYAQAMDSDLRNRLEQVKKKIESLEESQATLLHFTGDIARLEQKLSETTKELIEKSQAGDMTAVEELRFSIEALCEKKAEVSGITTGNSVLELLKQQKSDLESQAGSAHHCLTAPVSGVFSTAVDGFESLITPYNMTELTPSVVEQYLQQDNGSETRQEAASCKVVKNFQYHIAVNIPEEKLNAVSVGSEITLRLYDLSSDLVKAEVCYISAAENGTQTVILSCDQYIESLFKRRFVNLELIKKRYEGYRVSVKSLRTKDEVTGVYVRRDDVLKFIPVSILYNTQDIAIVDSADSSNPLRLYDEVVVHASSYEEGKLLR